MAYACSFSMDYHRLPLAVLILLWGVVLASSAAASVDWRQFGAVTPVKNQGVCDHSWAFAAVSVVESALLLDGLQYFDLSEQQVLDCSKGSGSLGCIKGNVDEVLSFITTLGGLSIESDYPYLGVGLGYCQQEGEIVPTQDLKRYQTVGNDENQLAEALDTHGPVAVTMCSQSDLVTYRGGIYNNPDCNANCNNTISMALVGLENEDEEPYWILKNSWGTLWGEWGFLKLAKGYNRCGIATHPSYFLRSEF